MENKETLPEDSVQELEDEKEIAVAFLKEQSVQSLDEFDETKCDEVTSSLNGKLMFVGALLHKPEDTSEDTPEDTEAPPTDEEGDDVIEAEVV